ncbi:MAG: hypothetical protein AABW81_04290 [Nanoarchaeota archaeon]
MTLGEIASILVILIRVFIPLTILRWPLAGAVLAILGDISDVMIYEQFGRGFLQVVPYHFTDKIFDI